MFTLRVLDALCICVGLVLAHSTHGDSSAPLVSAAYALVAFVIVSEMTGLYRNWRGSGFGGEYGSVLMTWLLTTGGLIIVGTCMDTQYGFSRQLFFAWVLMTGALFGVCRSLLRFIQSGLRAYGINTHGYAVVGITELGVRLAHNIQRSPHLGLDLIGFYDDRPSDRTADLPPQFGTCRGDLDELVEMTRAGKIHTIYITFPMRAEDRTREVLDRLADSTASVYVVPDFFVFELLHSRWNDILGVPVVSIFENPLYGIHGLLKRLMDVFVSAVALLVLAIPMLVIAAIVKRSSPGPVFYRQKRYGLDGCEIKIWKFRTMRVCEADSEITQATKDDPRVTPTGEFLRRTSLDELPQLFNVLNGEMSLVGPRPHANVHNEQYRTQIQGYMLRHKVKPGITGWAQVNGWRGETDTLDKMEGRVEYDHQYIREWSIWMDIKILFRTLSVAFSDEKAY
jgi:putative colanic acid biosynthesis UDP-glucose lipid carrier transferase